MTKEQIIIHEDIKGTRLDKALSELTDLSRSLIQSMLKSGDILVNNESVKANYKVQTGDTITYQIREVTELVAEAEDIPLDIYYEDKDVLVVNKPQGMVVHPAAGHMSGTLVNALLYHCQDLSGINGVIRPGIVHRIDKDTSGLLMVAKNDAAHVSLSSQLKDKTSDRIYLALVHGDIKHQKGTIEAPIGRAKEDRKKMAVVADGKEARTHFEVVERFGDYTLIKCQLDTGRTHQIRVHLKYIGHPLAADPKYGPKNTLNGHGQFLHASELGFEHPTTGERLHFEAPLPNIFEETLNRLREKSERDL
ncbi:RluA family pseudouridine synthase [Listeria fleischmannii]|uniref:Pseudouridine synthase n=1 Tax=Listeria fleischmannii TaxID=1069827 RepID=A0A841YH15_9LIST|nr:RluA family pseudouridine synthase [Listeria fleischmannii]EIA21298.1 ribosomal large subunit pseudouridine synthase, RluD subfamily protein [Listeria fleischmannii subsp. coloradonensis]MBC1399569.1 RluA family pseudouridine synthase [Listeria fleischmannii]MBC1427918.1 RluA family pseudouridine synthase [Listeria fleischmannii]STY35452.1 Ribosomal large subunit pseudouridine synthase D [Listeria fleischmannii subsp. coloradonensis]